MFNTILIANRGEIACRVIKTAKSMGIHTVAVYSTADKDSQHVRNADSAYWIGDSPAKDSYLNIDSIIQAAHNSGAQAIHPGYGFLSENPKFARACKQAGIVFIGPSVEAMEAMASKQLAKQRLQQTTVPLTPGYHGQDQSEATLLQEAIKIGFPVLIKAANGGGGKGMRTVHTQSEFTQGLAAAVRESIANFADNTMIIEKLILNPRHVELQIMADHHGNVVHLFERDCSIQRRHQKIIEEAPAPRLSDGLRKRLANAACEVAQSIDYRGAGTVEFLVDSEENFYFMEMNTRLQVEHPVTEMITGLDLVAWQIKIAANEPLPLKQDQIKAHGHAIECRIYAEDPHQGFLPSTGQIHRLDSPTGEGIRIDTGVGVLSEISMFYDPMIAKLIAWGNDRDEALQRLAQALRHYFIGGVKTNIPFLQAICQHTKFINAQLSTDFLSNETLIFPEPKHDLALLMAVSFDYLESMNNLNDPLFKETFSWRSQGLGHWTWRYLDEGKWVEAKINPIDNMHFNVSIKGNIHHIKALLQGCELRIETNKQQYKAQIDNKKDQITLSTTQGQINISRFNWDQIDIDTTINKGQLTAPMPSTVVAILKNIGDDVKAGERLIVLEAMKMEHTIHAPTDGVLLEIFYTVGSQVNEGAELLSLRETQV